MSSTSPFPSILEAINDYYATKSKHTPRIGKEATDEPTDQLKDLRLNSDKMPHHPAEENATGDITDKVAKESSDSNASSHKLHDEDSSATSGGSLHANAHKANPGPVKAENLGEPASREELKKRSEELNK